MDTISFSNMPLNRARFAAVLTTLILVCVSFVSAQDDEVIRISSDNVFVPVSVLDKGGKYISTLKREDFQIFENGIEQEIETFATIDSSVTILLLIERTGGIGTQLPRVVAAANAFVRVMRPEDSLMAMTFGSTADIVIDRVKIKDSPKGVRVGRTHNDRSGTQLYGAVEEAMKKLEKVEGRKAIVLFSEGYQTSPFSGKSVRSVLRTAEENDATIFTIRSSSPQKVPDNIRRSSVYQRLANDATDFMNGLPSKTGGRAFQIDQIENLDATFAEVARELVKQYTLGYSPAQTGTDGERRKITVKVNVPDAVVRARKEVVYHRKN